MQLKKVQRKTETTKEVTVLEITKEEFEKVCCDAIRELTNRDKKRAEGKEGAAIFRLLSGIDYAQLAAAVKVRLFEEEESDGNA